MIKAFFSHSCVCLYAEIQYSSLDFSKFAFQLKKNFFHHNHVNRTLDNNKNTKKGFLPTFRL